MTHAKPNFNKDIWTFTTPGGRCASGARVPHLAAGWEPHHRISTHPVSEPTRVHADRGEGEAVLPQ